MKEPSPNDIIDNTKALRWLIIFLILLFFIGMFGFFYIGNLDLIDSYHNTTMYLSGLGPITEMKTSSQKIFAGTYAIFASILFIGILAFIITRVIDLEFFKNLLQRPS